MSESNAPGETIHRGKNRCRLIITGDIEFTQQVINQTAPYDKHALTALRNLLDGGLRIQLVESYVNAAMKELQGKEHILKVHDITVEAAP